MTAQLLSEFGAGEESRTLDLNLGKVALYQLSYSRFVLRHTLSRFIVPARQGAHYISVENSVKHFN